MDSAGIFSEEVKLDESKIDGTTALRPGIIGGHNIMCGGRVRILFLDRRGDRIKSRGQALLYTFGRGYGFWP